MMNIAKQKLRSQKRTLRYEHCNWIEVKLIISDIDCSTTPFWLLIPGLFVNKATPRIKHHRPTRLKIAFNSSAWNHKLSQSPYKNFNLTSNSHNTADGSGDFGNFSYELRMHSASDSSASRQGKRWRDTGHDLNGFVRDSITDMRVLSKSHL